MERHEQIKCTHSERSIAFRIDQASFVQKAVSASYWMDNTIGSPCIHPLDSDLSDG